MSTPTIKIDQPTPGPGGAGNSREDLILGELVTLTDPANPPSAAYAWTMIGRPQGSAAALAGAATDTATFTPDVRGDYLIKLVVDGTDNSGADGVIAGEAVFVSTQGGCRVKLAGGGVVPSAGESNQFDLNGVARDFDPVLRDIDSRLPSVGEKASFVDIPTPGEKADLGVLNGAADGTIWYALAGVVVALAPGSAGQALLTQGAAAPTWGIPPLKLQSQQTRTGTTTVGVASPALIDGMTVTPGAGDYLVIFNSSVDMDTTNAQMIVQMFVNGVGVSHTLRTFRRGGSAGDVHCNVLTIAFLPGVGAGQAIEIRGNVTSGLASIYQRTMIVAKAEI